MESAVDAVQRARAESVKQQEEATRLRDQREAAQQNAENQLRNNNYRKASRLVDKIIKLMPKAGYLPDKALLSYDFYDSESEKQAASSKQVVLKQSKQVYALWPIRNSYGYYHSYYLREDGTIWKTRYSGTQKDSELHRFARWTGSGFDDQAFARHIFRGLYRLYYIALWRSIFHRS